MSLRFVTKSIHAYLDYPVAFALIGLPFIFGLGASNPLALWLSVGTGTAALILTLLTDHQFGVLRVLPYSLHLAVDGAVGVLFLLAPFLFGFTGLDAAYYFANGLAVAIVVSLHKPETEMAAA
ncbi:hypothetical protein SAMN04488518_101763 [Pseudovibrio ascidiaceicola]|uniref:SPW repeat-containing protein n=1 Tax=Pseudovibrio ascidiaceicola TaxID=285279 RepID=A0A1I3W4N9_9HYPH|nr:hypothetical protein [Pseudovibrio ascidiaceicola]SFK01391.1 hypothetical protein SAMN04488518_101763 [Pseudovibrio ascidiaceicola]